VSHKPPARRPDSFLDKITTFMMANLLWAVLASFFITLPAATAGLFATLMPWVQGKSSEPFSRFFGGIQQHWQKSTLIGLIDAGIAIVVLVNLSVLRQMDNTSALVWLSRSAVFFVAALTILTNVYLWPLLVTTEEWPLRQLIELALRLVFLHPLWSIFVVLLSAAPLLLTLFLPSFFALLITFSSIALLICWGAWHVIEPHLFDDHKTG